MQVKLESTQAVLSQFSVDILGLSDGIPTGVCNNDPVANCKQKIHGGGLRSDFLVTRAFVTSYFGASLLMSTNTTAHLELSQ